MSAIMDFSKRLYISCLKSSRSEIQNLRLWDLFWPIWPILTHLNYFIYFDLFWLIWPIWIILTYFWPILTYFELFDPFYLWNLFWQILTYLIYFDLFNIFWPILTYFDLFDLIWPIQSILTQNWACLVWHLLLWKRGPKIPRRAKGPLSPPQELEGGAQIAPNF